MALSKKHVLCLSFPGFGHIIPLLELAKRLSQFHQLTFIVSASKLEEMRSRDLIPEERRDKMQILSLEDGLTDDPIFKKLPEGRLLIMLKKMEPAVTEFLLSMPVNAQDNDTYAVLTENRTRMPSSIQNPVDIVIADRFITSLAVEATTKRGIPCYMFNCSAGFSIADSLDITEDSPVNSAENPNVELDKVSKDFLLEINRGVPQIKTLIFNTFREVDCKAFEKLALHPKVKHIPLLCVGPIFPTEKSAVENPETERNVTIWLDRQKVKSVVYISFGSIAVPSPEQVPMIATALTAMGRPFIWILDKNSQKFLSQDFIDNLATQFENSESKGLVLSWAPQKMILTHESAMVFITHAGWNSIMESIMGAVPMIAWPMFADQFRNAKWLQQNDLAVWIPNTKLHAGRIVLDVEIKEAVEKVINSPQLDENLKKWSETAKAALLDGGSSHRDFCRLIKFDF